MRMRSLFCKQPGQLLAMVLSLTMVPPLPVIAQSISDISREATSYSDRANEIGKFEDEAAKIKGKPKPSRAEAERTQNSGAQVKTVVPLMKRDLQTAIRKLKDSGKWNQLDSSFEKELEKVNADPSQKARFLDFVRQHGGAKAVLEQAVSDLDKIPEEVDDTVRGVRDKAVWFNFQLVPNAYAAMTAGGCLVICAAGILGTLGGCLACGVGAIVGAVAGGCL